MSDILQMTREEIYRIQIINQLIKQEIKQGVAAQRLDLSVRQIKRLKRAYQREGAPALLSKQRGRASHHQLKPVIKAQAVKLLRTRYRDFGPTFAQEKLTEQHGLALSVETVRRLMIATGLRQPHQAKRRRVHPLRERRPRFGELVQIDGSPYDWFEGRAPAGTLLVFIDDATGRLMELLFVDAETTFAYFQATEQYLQHYGKPVAFYSDKLSVFRVNLPNDLSGAGATQFGRAMSQLGIEVLHASSPQAKGRVERIIQVLQDRLVKEMRLRHISSWAEGNAYVSEFIAEYNQRFAVRPREATDAHRPLRPQDDLARILTVQELRHLSKNLTLSYENTLYQIQTERPAYALRNAQVVVRQNHRGEITIEYKGKALAFTKHPKPLRQAKVLSSKQLNLALDQLTATQRKRQPYVPPADHPWRRFKLNNKTKGSGATAADR